jgi:hypothetical protein
MRYGHWLPVFGGWLRNVPDEGMGTTRCSDASSSVKVFASTRAAEYLSLHFSG